jgi:hypothetical protein
VSSGQGPIVVAPGCPPDLSGPRCPTPDPPIVPRRSRSGSCEIPELKTKHRDQYPKQCSSLDRKRDCTGRRCDHGGPGQQGKESEAEADRHA